MNRTNLFLLIALIVQAVLIALIALPRGGEAQSETVALLPNFDPSAVSAITITDVEGTQLRLTKTGDVWGLADVENYPVQANRITDLFGVLSGLDTARLISDNVANQRRLMVADDEFERKVEITQGDQTYTLYVGTASGANATHTRLAGSDNVYINRNITATSVSVETTAWSETAYITLDSTKVVSMSITNINGTFAFDNVDGVWQMRDLAEGETFNEENFTALFDKIVAFNLRKPLGTEALPDYAMDTPLATVTVTVRDTLVTGDDTTAGQTIDTTYELVIGGRFEDGYAVKSNRSDFYVLASAFYATDFTEERREDFIITTGN